MKSRKVAAAFAARLRDLMKAKGYTSETARSGVDVSRLAEAADTSYEMARRYVEGLAVPRPDKLARIAEWLQVPAASLAWGSMGATELTINNEVLQKCIEAVMSAQKSTGTNLTTERAASLVAVLYEEAMDGRFPVGATLTRMIRAMG